MTGQWTPPMVAYAAVEGTVREQLRAAWDRGTDTFTPGDSPLADPGAPDAFDAIMTAVDAYAATVVTYWRDRVPAPGKQAGE